MLIYQVPSERDILQRQKEALEWQIAHDINEKDRSIHLDALREINKALQSNT
ncbi:hypothetical protein NDQ53_14425 [Rossellomorea marisflavi]|uniref:hypothetical protein n=1 Tax=Rossellomorea marisflavi TaxID=189381 RepID=UPI00203BA301|nr:hypothetical protein [Rossellomorea marisflavi]MCM2590495.1 hypothetical protein [Rossellomorea marisflavi]